MWEFLACGLLITVFAIATFTFLGLWLSERKDSPPCDPCDPCTPCTPCAPCPPCTPFTPEEHVVSSSLYPNRSHTITVPGSAAPEQLYLQTASQQGLAIVSSRAAAPTGDAVTLTRGPLRNAAWTTVAPGALPSNAAVLEGVMRWDEQDQVWLALSMRFQQATGTTTIEQRVGVVDEPTGEMVWDAALTADVYTRSSYATNPVELAMLNRLMLLSRDLAIVTLPKFDGTAVEMWALQRTAPSTWAAVAMPTPPGFLDSVDAVAAGDGQRVLVLRQKNGGGPVDAVASVDGGSTWTGSVPVDAGVSTNVRVALRGNGDALVVVRGTSTTLTAYLLPAAQFPAGSGWTLLGTGAIADGSYRFGLVVDPVLDIAGVVVSANVNNSTVQISTFELTPGFPAAAAATTVDLSSQIDNLQSTANSQIFVGDCVLGGGTLCFSISQSEYLPLGGSRTFHTALGVVDWPAAAPASLSTQSLLTEGSSGFIDLTFLRLASGSVQDSMGLPGQIGMFTGGYSSNNPQNGTLTNRETSVARLDVGMTTTRGVVSV